LEKLQNALEQLKKQVNNPPAAVDPKEFARVRDTVDKTSGVPEEIDALFTEMADVREKLGEVPKLRVMVEDADKKLNQVARTIDEGRGSPVVVPDILGSFEKSAVYQKQVQDVVHAVTQEGGALRVVNKLPSTQHLKVNGRSVWLRPMEEVTLKVPLGTLTTELVGYEGPKRWDIAPPNYSQEIEIVPKPLPPVVIGSRIDYSPLPPLATGGWEPWSPMPPTRLGGWPPP
jgi:hypothetical protein